MEQIIQSSGAIGGIIHLPTSKSISNRALILNALSNSPYPVKNVSDCDDTRVMLEAFASKGNNFDIGAAGTSMRFLTAYLSQLEGIWTITGTERMKNRPIRILVEALRQLGAEIEYTEKEGFPPLRIHGKKLRGGQICLEGNVSSQYISALMMIAPVLSEGLQLELKGEIISQPYIRMTMQLMKTFGVDVVWQDSTISIVPQQYIPALYQVESDWSAASYWYEMTALSNNEPAIELTGLYKDSTQGDSRVALLFEQLGITTEFTDKGVVLKKGDLSTKRLVYDFINEPDLAQTLVVTCALLNIPFRFTGLQSLRIKETDRISALQNEMRKLGYIIKDESDSILEWQGERCQPEADPLIATYEDHRMAMAFAPAALVLGKIRIAEPGVVSKSYPRYWEDLKKMGFYI